MTNLAAMLRNRDVVFILALVLGLSWGDAAVWSKHLVLPALGVIMTLSCLAVPSSIFSQPRGLIRPALSGLILSYVLLTVLMIALSAWLIAEPAFFRGMVVLAAVPPAIVVLPMSVVLDGDPPYTLVATMGAYLGGLVLLPAVFLIFFGSGPLFDLRLALAVVELILGPLLISRLLLKLGWNRWLDPKRGTITNWGFFICVYTIVGLNRQVFLHDPMSILPVALVAVLTTFVLGESLRWFLTSRRLPSSRVISMLMLGTLKNFGLAAGLALTLFDARSAVPATVNTIFFVPYLIWLSLRHRWQVKKATAKVE